MVRRTIFQSFCALLLNSYYKGFAEGSIYRGGLKQVCVPVLNCYSCPGAIGACPVGSLQAVASGFAFQFSFYVAGFLGMVGITAGRLLCGWVCPFGFIQDLLYRIPAPKFSLPGWMRWIKYAMLFLPVLALPALISDGLGLGVPYFCKWICPAGTLEAAVPLYILYPPVRSGLGYLFAWRVFLLLLFLVLVILVKRGFCQAFCPLGAFYSFFNPFSFYRLGVDRSRCTGCHTCKKSCFAGINVPENPNHPECIRCLDCVRNCPNGAISRGFYNSKKKGDSSFETSI